MFAAMVKPNHPEEDKSVGSEKSTFVETSPPILAYIDDPAHSEMIVPHAVAMAGALEASLTLLHVLGLPHGAPPPPDPIAWSIRRRRAGESLRQIAKAQTSTGIHMDISVVEGQPAEQICRWARDHKNGLTVLAIDDRLHEDWDHENIARKLVARGSGNLLLIPSGLPTGTEVHYRRLLVPLDGSYRAESVLPLAMRIARDAGAELVLAHVIPVPELTETRPLEAEDHRLREKVARRNERVAREYIERIRARMVQSGLAARTMIVRDGDVRSSLAKLMREEQADLLIMTSHGHSGRMDCTCGNVASYMLNHAAVPLLLALRPSCPNHNESSRSHGSNGRYPDRSIQ